MRASLEALLCNDVTFCLTFMGCLFLFSLLIAMANSVLPRERFALNVKLLAEDNPLAFITPDIDKFRHSFQLKLPRCGVVMPVKGVHDQSYANWRAQVTSMYGGPLEFFFCVESEDDPALPHIQRLQRENPEINIHPMVRAHGSQPRPRVLVAASSQPQAVRGAGVGRLRRCCAACVAAALIDYPLAVAGGGHLVALLTEDPQPDARLRACDALVRLRDRPGRRHQAAPGHHPLLGTDTRDRPFTLHGLLSPPSRLRARLHAPRPVSLHTSSQVEELETDAQVLAASGYAFEYVGPDVTSMVLAPRCRRLHLHLHLRLRTRSTSTSAPVPPPPPHPQPPHPHPTY
jgi:hypothetical protein